MRENSPIPSLLLSLHIYIYIYIGPDDIAATAAN